MVRCFSVGVHVSVEDVNEYPPEWDGGQSTVRVQIEEGQLLDHLLQVQAHDQDCSPKYGDVCGYEILQSDQQPFVISKEGQCFVLCIPFNREFLEYHTKLVLVHVGQIFSLEQYEQAIILHIDKLDLRMKL